MPRVVKFVVIPALLVVAAAATVGAVTVGSGDPDSSDLVIESLVPAPDDAALQQSAIEIDLESGWDGSLTINGQPVPDDQLTTVLSRGTITFQPGEGKVVEAYPAGRNCALLTYWPLSSPEQTFTESWCFTVL